MGMEWDSVSFSPRWMTRMHAMPTPHQPCIPKMDHLHLFRFSFSYFAFLFSSLSFSSNSLCLHLFYQFYLISPPHHIIQLFFYHTLTCPLFTIIHISHYFHFISQNQVSFQHLLKPQSIVHHTILYD